MATSPDESECFQPRPCGWGRAIVDRQTIHIQDISAGFDTEFLPGARTLYERTGVRTILATPLLREGDSDWKDVVIRRTEVRPFTDKQIALLKNLRRSSSHRHRERALIQGTRRAQQGIARGAGASDGNCRGARHYQPLTNRRAAGA